MSKEELLLHYQIVTDCWRAFKVFAETGEMGQWNTQIGEIRQKYPDSAFCEDIAWAFVKPVAKEAEKIRERLEQERKVSADGR